MADIEELSEYILSLTVLEAAELKSILRDAYGIEPAAGGAVMMSASPGDSGGADSAAAEEKDEFDVVLLGPGNKKINVIKEIRAITDLGLKEAKDLVEAGGRAVKEAASKDEAEDIKEKLEAAGAAVELRRHPNTETDDDAHALTWVLADWLALGDEAKRRSLSLDDTHKYVQDICNNIKAA